MGDKSVSDIEDEFVELHVGWKKLMSMPKKMMNLSKMLLDQQVHLKKLGKGKGFHYMVLLIILRLLYMGSLYTTTNQDVCMQHLRRNRTCSYSLQESSM